MPVTVKVIPGSCGLLDGQPEARGDGATVGQVLSSVAALDRVADADGKIRRHLNISINDAVDVRFSEGLDTPVTDGDTITILSALAGG